jgi:hypothetical protein
VNLGAREGRFKILFTYYLSRGRKLMHACRPMEEEEEEAMMMMMVMMHDP